MIAVCSSHAYWWCVLQVRAIDAAKRSWGDKVEWKSTLKALADEGKLEFIEDNDMITFDVPELQ